MGCVAAPMCRSPRVGCRVRGGKNKPVAAMNDQARFHRSTWLRMAFGPRRPRSARTTRNAKRRVVPDVRALPAIGPAPFRGEFRDRQEAPLASKIPQLQPVAHPQLCQPSDWYPQNGIRLTGRDIFRRGQPDVCGIQRSPPRVTAGAPVCYGWTDRNFQDSEFRTGQVGSDATRQLQLLRRPPDLIGHLAPDFDVIVRTVDASAIHAALDQRADE